MTRDIEKLTKDKFDVLIIGGGIHGATLAWAASMNGLYTALIEKKDFAQGASSNSQKIIHGGLRYLQQLDFPRIKQSVNERKRLMWLAPHLVHPLECVIPIYGYGVKGKEAMKVGLTLYDIISKSRNELPDTSKHIPNCQIISRDEIHQYIPDVEKTGLRGGAVWYDGYCYNTERLVVAFLKSASKNKTVVANYVNALNINSVKDVVSGVEACDEITGEKFLIHAENIIDCTGLTGNDSLFKDHKSKSLKEVAGINLVVKNLFPKSTAVGFQNRDDESSRLYFVLPWRGKSILGTEWFSINGSGKSFRIKENQIAQLIENFNKTYSGANLTLGDISFIHQGVVPGNGAYAGDISTLKKYKILDENEHGLKGLISVIGIKYTTAVYVAEQVMKKIIPTFKPKNIFDQPRLIGGEIDDFDNYKSMMIKDWQKYFDHKDIERIVFNYGIQSEHIFKNSISPEKEEKNYKASLIEQEVLNAIKNEMAIKLSDTILRRTEIGTAEMPDESDVDFISKIMAKKLAWNEEKRCKEIEELKNFYPMFDIN